MYSAELWHHLCTILPISLGFCQLRLFSELLSFTATFGMQMTQSLRGIRRPENFHTPYISLQLQTRHSTFVYFMPFGVERSPPQICWIIVSPISSPLFKVNAVISIELDEEASESSCLCFIHQIWSLTVHTFLRLWWHFRITNLLKISCKPVLKIFLVNNRTIHMIRV